MRNRLLAVWMTYWGRPLVIVLALAWLGVMLGPLLIDESVHRLRSSHPEVKMPRGTITRIEQLERLRATGRAAQVKGLQLEYLFGDMLSRVSSQRRTGEQSLNMDELHEPDLQALFVEFPNLEVVFCPSRMEQAAFESLPTVRHLRELSLARVQLADSTRPGGLRSLGGDDFQVLGELPQLEVLDLSGADIRSGLNHLTGLTNLHTLILSRPEYIGNSALDELRHLPNLRTLVIGPSYLPSGTSTRDGWLVTDAGLKSLAAISSLETVYIGPQDHWTVPRDVLQALLPNVTVRRGYYDQTRVQGISMQLCFSGVLLFLLISMHVTPQFALPSAHLTPLYSPANQIVPTIVLSVVSLSLCGVLLRFDSPLFPIAGLVLSTLSIGVWTTRFFSFSTQSAQGKSRIWNVLFRFGLLATWFILLQSSLFFPKTVDAYLLGDFGPILSWALLIIGGLALVAWLQGLSREAQRYAAAGTTAALGWKDMSHSSVKQQLISIEVGRVPWLYRKSDRFLEHTVSQRSAGWWRQLQLWRAGVPRAGWWSAVMAVIFGSMGMSPLWAKLYQSSALGTASVTRQDVISGVLLSLMATGMCLIQWWYRMPVLAGESLRPLTRRTLRRLTFQGMFLDMVPSLLISLGWLILACLLSPAELIPGMLSIWIVGVIALFAFVMWLMLIDRLWIIAVVLIASYLVATGVTVGLIALRHLPNDRDFNPTDLMLIAAGLFVVVALGLAYAWRRWNTVEFGKLAR